MTEAKARRGRLGSWPWALETGGSITDDDEATLVSAMASLAAEMSRPPPDGLALPGLSELSPPVSALATEAVDLWADATSAWLREHGYRTWYFARGLAAVEGLAPDLELLFVACLLHDLGLTHRAAPSAAQPCFAVSGAAAAHVVVEPHRSRDGADRVAEAIAMHLNIDVPLGDGDLNYLVAAGTLVDVAGVRLQLLPPRFVEEVLTVHPRGDFGSQVGDALEATGRSHPGTRCSFMTEHLGVGDFARACPLDDRPT